MTKLLLGTVLALATSVASASTVIWTPTDTDINYYFDTGTTTDTNLYAIFDVDDFNGAQANALVLNKPVDTIDIVANGSDFDLTSATLTGNTTKLYNDNEFVIATLITGATSWTDAFSAYELVAGTNLYNLTFTTGTVISIDATQVQAVPVPAAAWLFGTGLIGIVAVARRKS